MDNNIGKKFNKLKVLKFSHKGKYNEKYYLFECDCGNKKIMNFQNVKTGKSKSCGCNQKEVADKLRKFNDYTIKENFVIGIATNTKNEFYIDLEDYDKIKNTSWYEAKNGYMCHKDTGQKVILLHRYIMNAKKGEIIDHKNHNKKDDRKTNLRFVDFSLNSKNRKVEPKGITKIQRNKNFYYIVQLNGYRGCYKSYKEALQQKNKIIQEEYINKGVMYES